MSYSLTVQGLEEGGVTDPPLPFSYTGVPLLASFYFRYKYDDHHISQILINPDSVPGAIQLGYHDHNRDGDYDYNITHQIVDTPGILRVSKWEDKPDICSEIECSIPLARPTGDFVFVLIGFQLAFRGDRHIKRVRILEWDGNLKLRFRDDHNDPPPVSEWRLQYAWVPSSFFVELGSSSGRDQGAVGTDIPAGPSVIRGFSLDFRDDDRHLKEIGVLTGNGRLEVYYADDSGNDDFDWYVDWGILAT